jgi:hypothetical protein
LFKKLHFFIVSGLQSKLLVNFRIRANCRTIVVILIIDHKKKFLLQLTILAALKLTRAKAQNIIFVAEIWEKKLNIINAEIWENNAEI